MSGQFHELQVAGIVQESPDTRSYLFAVPESLREAFRYRAGQFLTFDVPWNDLRLRRCYSLSSAPESDPWPRVTIKRVAGGRVSNWFNDEVAVGDRLLVQAPGGRFTLRDDHAGQPVVLLGGGSGVTPMLSIMKSALRSTDRKVKLIDANRDRQSILFRDEIELWRREYGDRLEVVYHLDSDSGFMTVDAIQRHFVGWESADFYVCGPTGFMDAVEEAFEASGIDSAQTHFERFISLTDPDRKSPAEEPTEAPEGGGPQTFVVLLDGESHTVPYAPGTTLQQSVFEAGLEPPSSCDEGICGCCMAQMTKGDVHMPVHEALDDHDLEAGWILPCQARPTGPGPIEIDYDADY